MIFGTALPFSELFSGILAVVGGRQITGQVGADKRYQIDLSRRYGCRSWCKEDCRIDRSEAKESRDPQPARQAPQMGKTCRQHQPIGQSRGGHSVSGRMTDDEAKPQFLR